MMMMKFTLGLKYLVPHRDVKMTVLLRHDTKQLDIKQRQQENLHQQQPTTTSVKAYNECVGYT